MSLTANDGLKRRRRHRGSLGSHVGCNFYQHWSGSAPSPGRDRGTLQPRQWRPRRRRTPDL